MPGMTSLKPKWDVGLRLGKTINVKAMQYRMFFMWVGIFHVKELSYC